MLLGEGGALWCSLVAWGHLSKCWETVWAGFREVNTLAKVGENAELVTAGSPHGAAPLAWAVSTELWGTGYFGELEDEGSWGL